MKLLFIFGTRPEAIKLAPIIKYLQNFPKDFEVEVCVTGQHKEMLQQVLDFFEINPTYHLDIMKSNQSLIEITTEALKQIEKIISLSFPDLVIVQGDTTTAFVGALASYYCKVKVAHVEAGLRSRNLYSPFPEEGNRLIISKLADIHFTPTFESLNNLKNEGVKENIYNVGNSVIDALFLGIDNLKKRKITSFEVFEHIDTSKLTILVTAHRRESFGEPLIEICQAIKELSLSYPTIQFVFPVHLNPNVQKPVHEILGDLDNVHLLRPLNYPELLWILDQSYMVMTDSGGIQEEAPSLGKPILVLRDVTERTEGVEAGTAILVGSNGDKIIALTEKLIHDQDFYQSMAGKNNPYGDGTTSVQIANILKKYGK